MSTRFNGSGHNLVLASALALLSYVPFEIVAKTSLVVCAILFIFDPIPPLSRLLAILSLLVVQWLSKWHKQAVLQAAADEDIMISTTSVVEDQHQEQKHEGGGGSNNSTQQQKRQSSQDTTQNHKSKDD